MSVMATWAGGSAGEKMIAGSRNAVAISASVVLATVALSLWLCWDSRHSLRQEAAAAGPAGQSLRANATQELINHFEFSIWRVAGAAALVGAAALTSVLFIQGLWRSRLLACLEEQGREHESL